MDYENTETKIVFDDADLLDPRRECEKLIATAVMVYRRIYGGVILSRPRVAYELLGGWRSPRRIR